MKPTNDPVFAVLFDMDGVLINTEPSHTHAHHIINKRYGFTTEQSEHAWQTGGTLHAYYQGLQAIKPFKTSFDDFANEMLQEVFSHLEQHVAHPDADLLRLLEMLEAIVYQQPLALLHSNDRRRAN